MSRPGAAVLLLALVVAYAVCAPLLVPSVLHGPDFAAARLAPTLAHPFGTDYAGHDLFVRVALGLRVSLAIAVLCAAHAVPCLEAADAAQVAAAVAEPAHGIRVVRVRIDGSARRAAGEATRAAAVAALA